MKAKQCQLGKQQIVSILKTQLSFEYVRVSKRKRRRIPITLIFFADVPHAIYAKSMPQFFNDWE